MKLERQADRSQGPERPGDSAQPIRSGRAGGPGQPRGRKREGGAVDRWLLRLAAVQLALPLPIVLASFFAGLLSLPFILGVPPYTDGLTLNSDFTALLPEHAQSVRDLDEIQRRFGGVQSMSIVVESEDTAALHRFTEALAHRIEEMSDEGVVAVDWNVKAFASFVREHRFLYAPLPDLVEVRDTLKARLARERALANPFFVDLEEDEAPDPGAVLRRIREEADAERRRMERRYPEGFLQDPEQSLVVLVVHTQIRGGTNDQVERLLASLDRAVDDLGPTSFAPDMQLRYGGTLVEVLDETRSLVAAVRNATLLTVGLVLLGIFVFFRRMRPIPLLGLSLIPPVLLTFGLAELTVDYLNASSAFLSSIVVGNGINPCVVWLARFFESRRSGRSLGHALRCAHRETWRSTLTAALAAGLAYASLIVTDYRGFRDFGIIGGLGMMLCWISAYGLLPALVVLFEQVKPLRFRSGRAERGIYGVAFAKLTATAPRSVVGVSLLFTALSFGLVVVALVSNPLENDFRKLRTARDPNGDAEYVLAASNRILEDTTSGSALAVLAPDVDTARTFVQELEAYRAVDPKAYGRVTSIDTLMPADQEEKIALLDEVRGLLLEIRPYLSEEDARLVDENLPPADVKAVTMAQLPDSVARPFTERDGTRGRLLFLESHPERSDWDARYMIDWAAGPRSLRQPESGRPPPVAGTAVVFAELMQTVWRDGPRAVAVALFSTLLMLGFAFRRPRERALTLLSLLVGILWMGGAMTVFGIKLNFLNFVAFPITFGNGVDYSVNVMRRFVEERRHFDPTEAIRRAVEGTGGAVILCSLTTIIGYLSLYTSTNQALHSFGLAMGISEVTCLLAAVLALPALLTLMARRARMREARGETVDASGRVPREQPSDKPPMMARERGSQPGPVR